MGTIHPFTGKWHPGRPLKKGHNPLPRKRTGKKRMERGRIKRADQLNPSEFVSILLFTSRKRILLERCPAVAEFLKNAIQRATSYRVKLRPLWERGERPTNHLGDAMESLWQAETFYGGLALELQKTLAKPTISRVAKAASIYHALPAFENEREYKAVLKELAKALKQPPYR